MLNPIDRVLNHITMYRLVLYYVVALLGISVVFGFFHILPYSPESILFSTALVLATCWISNYIFAKVFAAAPNVESVYITGFILALIITPISSTNAAGIGFLIFASAWAMASKYIFAIGKKHIFNPAAFGVAISTLLIGQSATWWVAGNLPLLAFIAIGGILVVRKLRRFDLIASFFVAALTTVALTSTSVTGDFITPLSKTLLHSSLLFLASAMLTEPLTMPPSWYTRVPYGIIVGVLVAPSVHIGTYFFTPEVALLVGNLFVYIVSPKGRHILQLVKKEEIATGVYEYSFAPDHHFNFKPGQYLEWTIPAKKSDDRGNRRYFTIASSPTEKEIRLGVKFYEPYSSYKQQLKNMNIGATISTSHLGGDFVLPRNKNKKIVFIAGGIGVTPFRAMTQFLVDTQDKRQVTLFYSNKTVSEIAYKDVFDNAAHAIGMKTIYAVTDEKNPGPEYYAGMIDMALIQREVPDFKERVFYVSGPQGMVEAFKTTLSGLGVPRFNIRTDYFPGFA